MRGMADDATILLVDDEESIQKLLTFPLEREGYTVVQARDGEEALRRFEERRFDLVVLDVMCRSSTGSRCAGGCAPAAVPIIMLTARDDEVDKVLGLELGADDYITKPFSIREFRSRIRAVLRRAALLSERRRTGEERDPGGRAARSTRPSEPSQVAVSRCADLRRVRGAAHAGHAPRPRLQPRTLLEAVWGGSAYREPRTIDVHIRHLREKLESDPAEPC